ncbi:MAG: YbeD family protein [Gammaproteobacteria bacterium]
MNEPLLTFPCEFIIKVFGVASNEFEAAVITIIREHIADIRADAFRTRPSKDGKYIAMTITINANSREQLDNIYRDLTKNPLVLMAL